MSEEDHESTKGRKRERRNPIYEGRNPGKLETEENEDNEGKISAIALNQSARFMPLFVTFVAFCPIFGRWQNESRQGQAVCFVFSLFRAFVIRLPLRSP